MTDRAVYLQPAFILQQRKFRETSLIIDVLTRDFGRVSLLAKGVRKAKSKTAGLLQPFIPLTLSYFGKSELKTLTDVEIIQPFPQLQGLAVYCGFYVNELIGCFLHQQDPHPEVFACYKTCLSGLSDSSKIEAALRIFELDLLDAVGYGLQLNHDYPDGSAIQPSTHYHFNAEQGPIEAADGSFSGKTLQALQLRQLTDPQVLAEAKTLMRKVIATHLNGKPLKSRAVINQIIQHL
ncbi:DNA repair protein RecO [Methylobacter sp. S3L5C]|uniref:DNA repair protein RecO n=1 Tax=Methylobacter sp. S3L5C TaxID=2839024 RepID=UPI001FAB7D9D|nr:DNA repair protein RecO [Methylobacter sp. S3L5C]UOA08783.1 DNA repair protein RecO [Methylobacter sp. S3L5C]